MDRPAFRITKDVSVSDLVGETAPALAAEQGLENARTLFDFADQTRGTYIDAITQAGDFYNS